MLGTKSIYADECFRENYIGVGYMPEVDFTSHFFDDWRKYDQQSVTDVRTGTSFLSETYE